MLSLSNLKHQKHFLTRSPSPVRSKAAVGTIISAARQVRAEMGDLELFDTSKTLSDNDDVGAKHLDDTVEGKVDEASELVEFGRALAASNYETAKNMTDHVFE